MNAVAELEALREVARGAAAFGCCCALLARLGGAPPCLGCKARAALGVTNESPAAKTEVDRD